MENLVDDLKGLVKKHSASPYEELSEIQVIINKIERKNKINSLLSAIGDDLERAVIREIVFSPNASKYSVVKILATNDNFKNKTVSEYLQIVEIIFKKHYDMIEKLRLIN
jgi:hypothetical protein